MTKTYTLAVIQEWFERYARGESTSELEKQLDAVKGDLDE